MNKSLFLLGITLLLISSCQKLKKVTIYYDDGKVKETYYVDTNNRKQGENIEYYSSGNIKFVTKYTNGKYKDTLYYYWDSKKKYKIKKKFNLDGHIYYEDFYKDGSLDKKGYYLKNRQRIGIWKNYDKDGNHHFTKEYKIIDGKEYTNQMWVTLALGDTLTESVSIKYYFDKHKVKINDSVYCFFQVENSSFTKEDAANAKISVTLPKDYTQQNFAPDFANRPKGIIGSTQKTGIEVTTYPSIDQLQKIPKTVITVSKQMYRKTVAFYWKPKRTGRDTIRGYFKEKITFTDKSLPENKDEDRIGTNLYKNIYFDHPIEVIK